MSANKGKQLSVAFPSLVTRKVITGFDQYGCVWPPVTLVLNPVCAYGVDWISTIWEGMAFSVEFDVGMVLIHAYAVTYL